MHKKKWDKVKLKTEKTQSKSKVKLNIYIILMLLCIFGILYVIRLPEYQIKSVQVKDAVLTKESNVTEIVNKYLSENYLFVIPKSNIWFYPNGDMAESISKLPSVSDVTIDLGDDRILYVTVKERRHDFVWCNESNECFYMNKDGYIFSPSPNFEGSIFLTFRGVIVGDPLGQNLLDKDKMSEIISFIDELKKININIVNVHILTMSEVNLILDNKSKIIISIDKDLSQTLKNIKTLIESKDFINESGGVESVEYIDLRYNKKAFWK